MSISENFREIYVVYKYTHLCTLNIRQKKNTLESKAFGPMRAKGNVRMMLKLNCCQHIYIKHTYQQLLLLSTFTNLISTAHIANALNLVLLDTTYTLHTDIRNSKLVFASAGCLLFSSIANVDNTLTLCTEGGHFKKRGDSLKLK